MYSNTSGFSRRGVWIQVKNDIKLQPQQISQSKAYHSTQFVVYYDKNKVLSSKFIKNGYVLLYLIKF